MSDYQWTEKQIQKVYATRKHKKGFLNAREIRAGVSAADVRKLMKVIVDRGYAFDNELDPAHEEYEICFNLEEKDRIIEDLDRFDNSLLSDSRMLFIPQEVISKFLDSPDLEPILTFEINRYLEIDNALKRYQNRGKIEDFKVNTINGQGNKHRFASKHYKDIVIAETQILIAMYKAIKIGWRELKEIVYAPTYNEFFIETLIVCRTDNLELLLESEGKPEMRFRSQWGHLKKLANKNKLIEKELSLLIEHSTSSQAKESYRSILEDFQRNPYDRSVENAICVLCDAANRDTNKNHIYEGLIDIVKAYFAVVPTLPRESEGDIRVAVTKDVLALSTDPRVQKALSIWKNSGNKFYDLLSRSTRYYAQHPEERF